MKEWHSDRCEKAKTERCRCKCGGRLHGIASVAKDEEKDGVGRGRLAEGYPLGSPEGDGDTASPPQLALPWL